MVFHEWRNGIPVGFFIISRTREKDLQTVLQELKNTVQSEAPGWAPSSIIVDNAQAEINVLGLVFSNSSTFIPIF
jgi:MULE transposase domain